MGHAGDEVAVVEVPLEDTGDGWAFSGDVSDVLELTPDLAAALVTADDPSEVVEQYAPYRLEVYGVVQPGGGS